MCERGRIFDAEMCERGCVFNAGFAGFCAVFRRGERGYVASGDVRAGMLLTRGEFLTRGLRCSAQCFAGTSGGMLAGTVFFLKLLD